MHQTFADFVQGLVILRNEDLITKRDALKLLWRFVVEVLHMSPDFTLEERS